MNQKWKKAGALCFLISVPALMFIYPYINTPVRGVHSLVTGLDKAIPFIKVFAIPYAAWVGYLFITLIYLCLKDHLLAFKTILVLDLGLLSCFLIYYFYQTEGPVRPVIIGHDLCSRILQYIYKIDNPYNSFPSIHVFSSYLLIRAIRGSFWKRKWHIWTIGCFSTSIILATLFIKQHFIIDVISAIILVEILFKSVEIMYGWLSIHYDTLKEAAIQPSSNSV